MNENEMTVRKICRGIHVPHLSIFVLGCDPLKKSPNEVESILHMLIPWELSVVST